MRNDFLSWRGRGRGSHRRSPRLEPGFALLVVLWVMVLLALLTTEITRTGRTEALLAANLRQNAILQAEADGAVYDAIFRALAAGGGPVRSGEAIVGNVRVRVEDEAGKVDPNTASVELMRVLLQRVGADGALSAALAAAIAEWRGDAAMPGPDGAGVAHYAAAGRPYGPPGEPFESLAELGGVLGMTPGILARLAPHLSVWNGGTLQPALADPVVAAALRDVAGRNRDGTGGVFAAGSRTIAVTATASAPGGARFTRRADIRLANSSAGPGAGPGYRILTWTAPAEGG